MKRAMAIVFLAMLVVSCASGKTREDSAVEDKEKKWLGIMVAGDDDEVKGFIESGADVNERFRFAKKEKTPQWTPLRFAINFNRFAVAKMLIEAGADVNLSPSGITPLMTAATKANIDIDLVRMLLDKGANVNEQLEGEGKLKKIQGATALMFAAGTGRADVVKLLLERGADINAKAKNGSTALKIANRKLNYDVANLLKEAGARE